MKHPLEFVLVEQINHYCVSIQDNLIVEGFKAVLTDSDPDFDLLTKMVESLDRTIARFKAQIEKNEYPESAETFTDIISQLEKVREQVTGMADSFKGQTPK